MRWLNVSRPACALYCCYCGASGQFPHSKSFEHDGGTLSLYECTSCKSLIYDLEGVDMPGVSEVDTIGPEVFRHARYVLESGFSAYHVALCALAALPDVAEEELRDMLFVDVGAGMGMASHFVKTLFGMPTVTVEPSFTGKLAHEILGLEVHRAYFERLPAPLLDEMATKPCCLHLNSVVEHLVDPYAVLRDIVGSVKVEVLAAVVPDGAALDYDAPFLNALPFLSPRDHRHLPTKRGMEMLLRRLGFTHVHVDQASGLLTGVGSRHPIAAPTARETKMAEHLFLEHLKRHPDPLVAAGGASRLLPVAVFSKNAPLMHEIRQRFAFEGEAMAFLRKIEAQAWDDLPFHLGPSCYWLAVDAMLSGRLDGALALLDVPPPFADLMARHYPSLAMTSLEFKWAALLLKSSILAQQDDLLAAENPLHAILDSRSDAGTGARIGHRRQAEADLKALRAKAEERRKAMETPEPVEEGSEPMTGRMPRPERTVTHRARATA